VKTLKNKVAFYAFVKQTKNTQHMGLHAEIVGAKMGAGSYDRTGFASVSA